MQSYRYHIIWRSALLTYPENLVPDRSLKQYCMRTRQRTVSLYLLIPHFNAADKVYYIIQAPD